MMLPFVAIIFGLAVGQEVSQQNEAAVKWCNELNHVVLAQTASGELAGAEGALSSALAQEEQLFQQQCGGMILSNMAVALTTAGRLVEAETVGQRSLNTLKSSYAPDAPALLRPLHALAIVLVELGKHSQVWEIHRQMKLVHSPRAEDRAMVHCVAAMLLKLEGRERAAELEYLAALKEWEPPVSKMPADVATILTFLGSLYVEQGRFQEARRTLEHAFAVLAAGDDTVSSDHIKLFAVRASFHARQARWHEAENDLRQAIALADRESFRNPRILAPLLADYATALRKIHRTREARSIEARASALTGNSTPSRIVDLTGFAPSKSSKR